MNLSFEKLALSLHEPFTIARSTQIVADNIYICLRDGQNEGRGEAAPAEQYGELQNTVIAFLEQLRPRLAEEENLPISTLHSLMDEIALFNPAAKAAIDLAAYDLLGKKLGAPVYEILGLNPSDTPRTSFTIGIDTPQHMARKAQEAGTYPILKVKVGTAHDEENLDAIRQVRPDATIRVDANCAWNAKQAIERIEALSVYDLEFIEQPVPDHDLEGLGQITASVTLPVIADESCITPRDVPRVAPYVDGINIKLMKCGGIYPALQMIFLARAHNLQIMMGCMIESSLAITAAAHLSPLIDYADLDGHLLIDEDPYIGVQVDEGKLVLPTGPGLGLSLRE
jgi:L-Ala-D/L-Glu epimerase